MSRYVVTTEDVDGRFRNVYKTRAAAVKRFEEMAGLTMQQAVDFRFDVENGPPATTPESVRFLKAVSDFGTVVWFQDRGPQPKKGQGLQVALAYLRELVAFGVEYPDAEWKAVMAYGVSGDKLRDLYDEKAAA